MTGDPIGRFLRHAAQRPDHPAVEIDGAVVSYHALAERARRLAGLFLARGAEKILIALPQGPDAYAAMLGALLAGAFYVPVNTVAPAKKITGIIDQVRPDVVLAESALSAVLAADRAGVAIIDPDAARAAPPLTGDGRRHDTAYVIFTSGSTGVPKGVVIPTSALAHYVDWLSARAVMRPTDRVSQFPNISFDLSVLDIFGALNAGATLVVPAGNGDRLFPGEFVQATGITVWVSVPSAFALAMSGRGATAEKLGTVRSFIYCGEPLLRPHLAAMFAACPACEVINLYGPTEATVSMTAVALHADDYHAACADTVAFGDAIPGMGLHLVGGAHDDEGEIVITGPQLAAGYWNDPARTEAAFRPVTTGGVATRGYYTGDWGERRGGHVFFKGRIDRQVKIAGHRIETGEIVARLAECGFAVSCVLKHGETLTAVVEIGTAQEFDAERLRRRLFDVLDAYAVPGAIRGIGVMPRNANDKIDEGAVRGWLEEGLRQGQGFALDPPKAGGLWKP